MTQLLRRTEATGQAAGSAGTAGTSGSTDGRPQRGIARSMLPNGRAVLGGFLIAASAVGLFAAYQQANAAPITRFVVATEPLTPGQVIERSDLGLAPAELPPEMAGALTDDWQSLLGKETTVAVAENQLLSPASLIKAGSSAGAARRVSLELSRAGAIDGNVQGGAVVDILASTEGDQDATVVAERARVIAVSDSSTGDLGQLGTLIVTVEVPDQRSLSAVVGADASGTVTLAAPTPGGSGDG